MAPDLEQLIVRFRAAQDHAVNRLLPRLAIERPESNRAWAAYCIQNRLHEEHERNGVSLRVHGFSIEVEDGEFSIDFDWGDRGEPDGFDSWRLCVFGDMNLPNFNTSEASIRSQLEDAHRHGELTRDSSLYYDPKRRANH